jgi:hypothetical protein
VISPTPFGDSLNGLKKLRCTFQRQAAFQPNIVCGYVETSLPVDTRKEVHFLNGAVVPVEKGKKCYVWLFVNNRIDLPCQTFASWPD